MGTFDHEPFRTPFAGYDALRDLVASRVDSFARGLVEALISYGLGRPLVIQG